LDEQPQPWTVHLTGFLYHPDADQVWLQTNGAGWRLPAVHLEQDQPWLRSREVIASFSAELGMLVDLLRLDTQEDKQNRQVLGAAVLELQESPPQTPGRWAGREAASTLTDPAERTAFERFFFEEQPENIPLQRAPWARRGWHARARDWICASLSQAEFGPVKALNTLRTWSISCLLTAETESGELFYYKAVLDQPLFVNEGPLTLGLAQLFPEIIQPPVAVNVQERWMVTPAFAGNIEWAKPLSERAQLIQTWAGYQKRSVHLVDELLASGCIDRRLDWLAGQVQPLFEDEKAIQALTAEEKADLLALAPRLVERCHALAACEIPPALVHGDLHGGNVAVRPDGLTIFDWTDACITHPFLDMLLIYNEDNVQEAEALRRVYLEQWAEYASPARLDQLWELARPVFNLHHALSYHTIVKHVERTQKGDLDWGAPHFLRKILESYKEAG
jgi:hypothetical protein